MASFFRFGRWLPERVLDNRELAGILGCDPEWILQSSGIEERRIADPGQTVADLGVLAAQNCLHDAPPPGLIPGLILVASGSSERRFPGPAVQIAQRLGFAGIPAIDLPIASAGSLVGVALAAQLTSVYGPVLVVAAEKMSGPATAAPLEKGAAAPEKNVAIIFGDGAGACLIVPESSGLQILDSALHTDGANSEDLRLGFTGPVEMNGMAVIRQATRRLPEVINEVLLKNRVSPVAVLKFLMHQANQNLIDRVARSLDVPSVRFYSNIRRYGNTSSASMLIAASEWYDSAQLKSGDQVCSQLLGPDFTGAHCSHARADLRSQATQIYLPNLRA